jgi:hypothetical protein
MTNEHWPVVGSHESVVHRLPSSQVRGVPWQVIVPPPLGWTQWSSWVHRSASSHGAFGVGVKTHVPVAAAQVSVVHGLPSSHWIATF